MKKTSVIINAILVVAVIVLYVLHFSSPKTSGTCKTSNDSTKSGSVATGGIVYINIDSVLNNYDMYDDIREDLQAALNIKDAELQSKQRKFEKAVTDYQNKASKGLVTRTEAAQMEQNLQAEQQTLMQQQQQAQYQLAEEEQVAQRKVLNSIMEYLKTLEGEKDYQFVLGNSFGGNILYANDNLNITEEVIEGLNAEYTAAKQ